MMRRQCTVVYRAWLEIACNRVIATLGEKLLQRALRPRVEDDAQVIKKFTMNAIAIFMSLAASGRGPTVNTS
jgi:hypothetical protein